MLKVSEKDPYTGMGLIADGRPEVSYAWASRGGNFGSAAFLQGTGKLLRLCAG